MDNRIRRNESCIIGSPNCDYVFSSSRSCFIAYGFKRSTLEMEILSEILRQKGIEPIEAGGIKAPGQNAFCVKICSKIITSQFCIVLINNDTGRGQEIPNANVNMEYGLMLGFNKYIIPFQIASQTLPFNVAALDTIKYTDQDFKDKACKIIDVAIEKTKQETFQPINIDQILETFLLMKKSLIARIESEGDKNLFDLGRPLGFNMLTDFSGMNYIYLGNFTPFRTEVILWRIRKLNEIIKERSGSIDHRVASGIVNPSLALVAKSFFDNLQIWIIVTSAEDKRTIIKSIREAPIKFKIDVYSIDDIHTELLNQT